MKSFEGKVAVITGAGRGIGRGIALRCAIEGMKVVLAGIGMESLSKTNADLQAMGAETLVVQTDVSLLEDVETLAEKSFETFGAVDLLINNAGVAVVKSVLESTMDDWNWVMGVNFYGVLYGVRAFLPSMMKQGTPCHVVNVSSRAGLTPGGGSYSISKHAVIVLTESLYFECATDAPQVAFSVYCPGTVNSEMYRVDQSRSERFKENESVLTEDIRAAWKDFFEKSGMPIEEAVDVLFNGIQNNQLYIGPKAFPETRFGNLAEILRTRTKNMINEQNPERLTS